MKYIVYIIFFTGLIILGWFYPVQAANHLDVVINEIAWMGTTVSYNDEWIELRNNTGQEINLDGWILKAADGTPEIKLTENIPANGFYLLERSKDYTGALENSGEVLELYNNLGNLIDKIDASSGWPAGNNDAKQTMERTDSSWQTSQNPGGTPKAENSVTAQILPQPSEELQEEFVEVYPAGVVINEILPSPIGPDEEEEWIEIFNKNDFKVDISGWKISDVTGKTGIYTFPEKTLINPAGFLVLNRPTTKLTLNNQGDGLKLVQPDGNMADEINYQNAPRGESYGLFQSSWKWTLILTPGSANALPAPAVSATTPPQSELAAVSEQIPRNRNAYFLFFAAAFTSFSCGVIILVLKKKLKLR